MNNVEIIKFSEIDTFKDHPFSVVDDESLRALVDSIRDNGLLNPLVVRKKDNGRYELISGHRRLKALDILGKMEAECIVKDLNDDEATIYMVDSNMYRERILPSERAFAYKMKFDALKHQGKSSLCHNGTKLRTTSLVGKNNDDSARQVSRYIRLTYLIPELLKLVDETYLKTNNNGLSMGLLPAVELSYLGFAEQKLTIGVIDYCQVTPSHAQAIKIRKMAKDKTLDFNSLEELLNEKKGNQNETISFNKNKIENVIPLEVRQRDKRYVEQYIIAALIEYKKNNHNDDVSNVVVKDMIF